ncbi:MAG: DUF1700 domain-containing protein [Oscillospiraceae bacterium]|nr:DUF1700 domain-containing protein [Oscillospiraceae bacterium]
MNRKQYIRALEAGLRFRLPAEEVTEILEEIAERFEDGAAEGATEDVICAELGSPSVAAAEFLQRTAVPGKTDILRRVLPAAISLLITGLFVYWSGNLRYSIGAMRPSAIAFLLPIVPWLILLLTEGKKCVKNLRIGPADRAMALCALLLTGAGIFCVGLINEARRSPDSYDLLYMLLCTALMVGAMAAWAVSVCSHGGKYLLLLPASGAAAAIWAAAESFDFFDAYAFNFMDGDPKAKYYGYAGEYLGAFTRLIFVLSALCLICAVIRRDAFSLPTLSLLLGCCGGMSNVFFYLRRLDPMDMNAPACNISVFIPGIISAAVWLAVTLIIRGRKNSVE